MAMSRTKPILINFLGAPASGKTTTAATVFANLKEEGNIVEFVCEYARRKIVDKRYEDRVYKTWDGSLTAFEQEAIFRQDINQTERYVTSCSPETIIVSDSSPLNAILYNKNLLGDKAVINDWLSFCNPIIFYATPVSNYMELPDINRIHDLDQIKAANDFIPQIISNIGLNVIELTGNNQNRTLQVLRTIYKELSK